MELSRLLEIKPSWAYEPCLYIIRQTDSINAFRCGASGTKAFKDEDRVFGADRPGSLQGLLSRCAMYLGFYEPLVPKIYAALRIRKQLVAKKDQRTGTDFQGNTYNIDKGGQTLVLAREALMHDRMDRRNLRWKPERKNELFVPKKSVDELIAVMRTIPGEEMYIFGENSIEEDTAYRGGRVRTSDDNVQTNTTQRTQPGRELKDNIPSVRLKLSRRAIQELSDHDPETFVELVKLFKDVAELMDYEEIFETKPVSAPPTQIIRLPKRAIEALRGNRTEEERAFAIKSLNQMIKGPPPPSPPPPPQQPPQTIPRRVTRAQTRANRRVTHDQ